MAISYLTPEFEVLRDPTRCIACRVCERQCANGVHSFDDVSGLMLSDEAKCVDCQRCVCLCPTHALKIVKNNCAFRENANWQSDTIKEIYKQAPVKVMRHNYARLYMMTPGEVIDVLKENH